MADTDSIIRLKTVLARTGLSRSTLYRKISEGTFPRQTKISVRSAGWHCAGHKTRYKPDSAICAKHKHTKAFTSGLHPAWRYQVSDSRLQAVQYRLS